MRKSHHRRLRGRSAKRTAPSVSIAGYTRFIDLSAPALASGETRLVTADVADVENTEGETVNRKLVRVEGQAMFTAGIAADKYAVAQFCLWAHPKQEDWPTVDEYDPFNDGPGESSFEGMLAPRSFCRRTFVIATPTSGGVEEVITAQHMIRSKAERLLRPGWVLSAGLYLKASDAGISARHTSLLRYVVAG